ncbi:hypothetical protein [Sinimarinibacterium thermocellulolyticum]|jgi:hypothetical protein|uniref:Uncharacterized protein n=1 Tax=Sinimarinibacterium thermocellulolyticum TaxID=3170016 RepID=A0ABV2A8V9_9GAMM
MQSISILPLSIKMNAEQLDVIRELLANLDKARRQPHLMDDEGIDRILRLYTETKSQTIPMMRSHLAHWRKARPTAQQGKQLDQFEKQLIDLESGCESVLACASEIRKGTIDRVMAMSDEELGLAVLLGQMPAVPPPHVPDRVDVKRFRCPKCDKPISLAIFAAHLSSVSDLQDIARSVWHHLEEFDLPANVVGQPMVEDILAGLPPQQVRHATLQAWPTLGKKLSYMSSDDAGKVLDALLLKHRCKRARRQGAARTKAT